MHSLEDALDLGSAAVDEDAGIDSDVVLGDLINETILEQGLRNCDEDGAAKSLHELDACSSHRHPCLRQIILHDKDADLETSSDTQPRNDLVAKPLSHRRVDVERGDHS